MEPRLKVESPKVYALIMRTLPEPDALSICQIYEDAVKKGLNEEPFTVRKRVTSFNPRAARVLKILIDLGGVRDYQTLSLALGDLSTPGSSLSSELTQLAFVLDEARHLHMSSQPPERKREIFEDIVKRVIPGIKFEESGRIKTILQTWVDRFQTEYAG